MAECGSWYRSATARTRAAKPAAEEARPAAVGKLLMETRRRGKVDRDGRVGFASSRVARRARRAWMQARGRGVDISCGEALRRRVSSAGKEAEQEAVVWVRRSDWERVMEREELVGRFRVGSRFPQYLVRGVSWMRRGGFGGLEAYFTTAMLTGAVVLAR